jgi:hypothetical protein
VLAPLFGTVALLAAMLTWLAGGSPISWSPPCGSVPCSDPWTDPSVVLVAGLILGGGMVSMSRSSDSDSDRMCGLLLLSCSSAQSSPLVFMKRSGSVSVFWFPPLQLLFCSSAVSSRGKPSIRAAMAAREEYREQAGLREAQAGALLREGVPVAGRQGRAVVLAAG